MEGRKRWYVASVGFNPEETYLPGRNEHNVKGMFWTGKLFYPMWTHNREEAASYGSKDEAENAAFVFVAKRPEWLNKIEVFGFIEFGPKIGEAGER